MRSIQQFFSPLFDLFLHEFIDLPSSHPEVFLEKGVLKIYSKFPGEHPCRSVTSIKLLYWNHTSTWVFSCKFAACFRTPFPKNTSGRLLDLPWIYLNGQKQDNELSRHFASKIWNWSIRLNLVNIESEIR